MAHDPMCDKDAFFISSECKQCKLIERVRQQSCLFCAPEGALPEANPNRKVTP